LTGTPPELKAWLEELQSFLVDDAQNLPEPAAHRVLAAMQNLESDKNFEAFLRKLEAVPTDSDAGRKLADILKKREAAVAAAKKRMAASATSDDPLMNQRNEAMVNATISNSPDSGSIALVVGSLHLPGITERLRAAGRPFVSILAA